MTKICIASVSVDDFYTRLTLDNLRAYIEDVCWVGDEPATRLVAMNAGQAVAAWLVNSSWLSSTSTHQGMMFRLSQALPILPEYHSLISPSSGVLSAQWVVTSELAFETPTDPPPYPTQGWSDWGMFENPYAFLQGIEEE